MSESDAASTTIGKLFGQGWGIGISTAITQATIGEVRTIIRHTTSGDTAVLVLRTAAILIATGGIAQLFRYRFTREEHQ